MVFVKGHPGYKPKGAKAKKTLLMEERRSIFDAEMSKMFLAKIKKARAEYLLDQFIGKATETIKVKGLDFMFNDSKDVVE